MEKKKSIEVVAVSFILAYGLHYLGYFIRKRYYSFVGSFGLDAGVEHVFMYLGHIVFLIIFILFMLACKSEQKFFLAFKPKKGDKSFLLLIAGLLTGLVSMGTCILSAKFHGDIEISIANNSNYVIFIFGFLAVFIQASIEEIESRCFLFGKMKAEGVPVGAAIAVSAFFFSYLHEANPGFGLIPLLSIVVVGVEYALAYHYFGNVWFCFGAHTMWNFTQDFLFGLPDSGKPAAVSVMNTTVNGSSFFYSADFGIEGSFMAICVNLLACILIFLIGRKVSSKRNNNV